MILGLSRRCKPHMRDVIEFFEFAKMIHGKIAEILGIE